jgi:glucoamylase|tara:strand:- start:2585 stop:3736 length:1152 start_codon:yes stop_codon:yes gene_type:complete
MANQYVEKILQRIMENTNTTTNPGIIIASPSEDPPYKYHWIRDSALVMRTIMDMYVITKNPIYFQYIINYIENESKLQKLDTISGLGEPKYNINCTAFNGSWGRPQNDGPALRGIMLFKIIELFNYKYDTIINNLIVPILVNDIKYIQNNYNKISFDIWEEIKGWHFYTRMVQLKFLKDSLRYKRLFNDLIDFDIIKDCCEKLSLSLKDHICDYHIISSFDESGEISKYHDAANILAYCHIDYDKDILKIVPLEYINETCFKLIDFFREKYSDQELNLIGRYPNDKYYDGEIWILCSLALGQIYIELYKKRNLVRYDSPMHRSKSNPNNNYIEIANQILERILTLDPNLILAEQFNPKTNKMISANKLTWNYSELYKLYKMLN